MPRARLPWARLPWARLPWARLPRALLLVLAVAIAGCSVAPRPTEPGVRLLPATFAAIPGWHTDPLADLERAIARQCDASRSAFAWSGLCDEARSRSGPALRAWIESRFDAYAIEVTDREGATRDTGLLTGYYEPLLNGSRERGGPYQVPLYRQPDDLLVIDLAAVYPQTRGLRLRGRLDGKRVVPYWSRAEIENGRALTGHEILWVDDAVDAFFLQIQGSGKVRLPDRSTVRVGYANQNGHPYRAIGRELVERGALSLEDVSAPAIRAWLATHPGQARELMQRNPSYVFFRELPPAADPEEGPPGSMGVPLTPLRSLAIDPAAVPLGSFVYFTSDHRLDGAPVRRLALAQDSGGAIRGAIRADLFWGAGDRAQREAGVMRARMRLWLLWPRGQEPPIPAMSAAAATR
ncbi:MAG: murein transglycosylase A [Burkholderiales bacterium]|nr:MAG: murein transglycosylase A [Burkholderiales bacterium]